MTQKISDMGVSTQPSSSPSWLLKNASLLHGESLTLLTGHDVLIASGRITRIAPSGGMASNEDTVKAVDASGYLILPGFVNACVSLKQMPVRSHFLLGMQCLTQRYTTESSPYSTDTVDIAVWSHNNGTSNKR